MASCTLRERTRIFRPKYTVATAPTGMMAIAIGLYPLLYLLGPRDLGLLGTKSEQLLQSPLWNSAFYGHITFGGIALLTGWTQFSRELRRRYLKTSLGLI